MMTDRRNTEETIILATYGTRRDAEVAREYLADADIPSFVSSDDAGGMYPQMQRPNGVKLVGMGDTASEARSRLEEAGLYPEAPPVRPNAEGWGVTIYALAIGLGLVAVGLVLLMALLG